MEDLKHTFSIQLPISLYQKIVNEAGKGKVSTFIREILEKELRYNEDKLANEYRECYSNPRMIKEAKQ
jgi:predicted DNA-binding protein